MREHIKRIKSLLLSLRWVLSIYFLDSSSSNNKDPVTWVSYTEKLLDT
jgi:hypothetical protein